MPSARFAEVEGTDGGDHLHAQLGRSVAEGIAAAGADASEPIARRRPEDA